MKYIDADRLKVKVKELNLVTKTYEEQVAFNNALAMVVEIIDSLQREQPEVFDSVAFQKGVEEGRRLEREDVKSTIQSRIDEILGDAQPAPILRMELQELIKKIEA